MKMNPDNEIPCLIKSMFKPSGTSHKKIYSFCFCWQFWTFASSYLFRKYILLLMKVFAEEAVSDDKKFTNLEDYTLSYRTYITRLEHTSSWLLMEPHCAQMNWIFYIFFWGGSSGVPAVPVTILRCVYNKAY